MQQMLNRIIKNRTNPRLPQQHITHINNQIQLLRRSMNVLQLIISPALNELYLTELRVTQMKIIFLGSGTGFNFDV
jgi:hypothetical protein